MSGQQKNILEQAPKPTRRRKKDPTTAYQNRQRFVIDGSRTPKVHALAVKLLTAANKKEQGREVTFEKLAALALSKVNNSDLERLQRESLTDMDKVNLKLKEYNRRHKTNLTLGQFLVKELNIKNNSNQQEKQDNV